MPPADHNTPSVSRTLPRALLGVGAVALLACLAIAGWIKLQYGFNMTDEGMYMTDGWRLATGDRLFPDSSVNAVMLYALFNALVFKVNPDITLLGFRHLQHMIALGALACFGVALWRWRPRPWLIMLTLSVFAFTGLEVLGNSANLSYYTYPHLFFLLHLSLMLFAFASRAPRTRTALFLLAGVALWAIGLSLLPLAATMVMPLALWLAARFLKITAVRFTGRELMLVLAPGIALWALVLAIAGADFLRAILNVYGYVRQGGVTDTGFDRVVAQYVGVAAIFVAILVTACRLTLRPLLCVCAAGCIVMYAIIDSNLFGLLTAFWRGWFPRQMWFCALLIATMAALLARLAIRRQRAAESNDQDFLLLVLLLPAAVFALVFSRFSNVGVLVTAYVGAPVCMALVLFVAARLDALRATDGVVAAATIALLAPFYVPLARADWEFTYFDLPPRHLQRELTEGFGAGIRTSEFYQEIVQWMTDTAATHSTGHDYAIVLDQAAMGYMVIKRRPALNHSWTGWALSAGLRRDAVETMIAQDRQPKIAYRFLRAPILVPVDIAKGVFQLGNALKYPPADPISAYITTHMRYAGTFVVKGEPYIELYIRD